jgi:hypothetical protein
MACPSVALQQRRGGAHIVVHIAPSSPSTARQWTGCVLSAGGAEPAASATEVIAVNEYRLGKVAGLSLNIEPPAIVGSILVLLLLACVAIGLLNLPICGAIVGSLAAVALHWVADIVHHLGHAWAARRTGYPMIGIRLGKWGLLGTSVYPPDEQALPAKTHIRRALAGPIGSLLFSVIAAATALLLHPVGGVLAWVGVFFFLDSFIVFVLGAFLPLGFTDGSTLLHWWGKR